MNPMPGDIFLTQGTSFISRAIRFFSRTGGEPRTKVNHVGLVTRTDGTIVEALSTVKRRNLSAYRRKSDKVAIYAPLNVELDEVVAIVAKADSYVGRKYGYLKIVAHLIDWFLGGRYVARRFVSSDNYPICSWVVAQAYSDAGYTFGVEPGAASPDDIWDFIQANPDKFHEVHPLERLA